MEQARELATKSIDEAIDIFTQVFTLYFRLHLVKGLFMMKNLVQVYPI